MSRNQPRRRKWRITIYNRGQETVLDDIPTTHMTEKRIVSLLKMLYAKLALSNEEIAQSHLRANVKGYYNHMRVGRYIKQDPIWFKVGGDSIYTHAVVVRPEDPNYDISDEDRSTTHS